MFGTDEELPDTNWASAEPSAPLLAPQSEPETAPMPVPAPAPMPASAQPAQAPLDASARRGAGTALLLSGGAATAGWVVGGAWGAGAGFLLLGAVRNAWRAKTLWPSAVATEREEAAKSATMAVVGVLLGGYLSYRAVTAKRETDHAR